MTPEMRYMVANARLASLSDVLTWTAQELQDVFALTSPSVPFDDWAKRATVPPPAVAAPVASPSIPEPTPEDPDPETSRTMAMLLGPEGKRLQDLGIVSIKEVPA